MCHWLGKNLVMKEKNNYLIPAGTLIKTRNVECDLKLRPHMTRQELEFDEIVNTGDVGLLLYFQHGKWLIAVETHCVLNQCDFLQAPAA